jgi:hypothetical protein
MRSPRLERDRRRRSAAASRSDLRERFRRRVDARDQVEGPRQQLQCDEPWHLGDLLIAVTVRVQALDVGVADLPGPARTCCAKAPIAAMAASLDVPWRASTISLSGTPSWRAARVCATRQ